MMKRKRNYFLDQNQFSYVPHRNKINFIWKISFGLNKNDNMFEWRLYSWSNFNFITVESSIHVFTIFINFVFPVGFSSSFFFFSFESIPLGSFKLKRKSVCMGRDTQKLSKKKKKKFTKGKEKQFGSFVRFIPVIVSFSHSIKMFFNTGRVYIYNNVVSG